MAEALVRRVGLPTDDRPVVVTVGTFDGVHLGHQAVLQEIGSRARACGGRSVLVTFDPHPLRIVRPEIAPKLLTTPAEKKPLLAESPLDYVVFLPFTSRLRHYSPKRFVSEVLLDGLGMSELVIGYDHGFGRGRSGDVNTLHALAAQSGFNVDVVEAVGSAESAVSSSQVRRALTDGRLADANRSLGRLYSLTGTVVKGDGRGRQLGFPTANLLVHGDDKLIPQDGIYACYVTVAPGDATAANHSDRMMGALHIGPRPTFPGASPAVEVFLLDFDSDLLGRKLRLELSERLRPVVGFATAQELVQQMHADVEQVRMLLGKG